MPTSSQALILINTDGDTQQEFNKLNITENRSCPMSRISFQGEQLSQQTLSLSSREETPNTTRRESPRYDKIPFPTSTVKGYKGVFAFDPVTRSFSWQLLSDSNTTRFQNVELPSISRHSISPQYDENKIDSFLDMAKKGGEMPLGRVPDPIAFESNIRRLMNLGFRSESNKLLDHSDGLEKQLASSSSTSPLLYKKPNTQNKLLAEYSILPSRRQSAPVFSGNNKDTDISQTSVTRLPRRMDSFVLNYKSIATPYIPKPEERALYEEVKQNDAKKKKKKYIPTIRMRRELPPLNSNMLCFNFYDGNFSHKDVKQLIESQCETKILDLKFDPIYVHLGEISSQYKCMWVFSISDATARANLLYYGLHFNDEKIKVRLYDDVMMEEHNAFKLYKEVEDEQIGKQLKPNPSISTKCTVSSTNPSMSMKYTVSSTNPSMSTKYTVSSTNTLSSNSINTNSPGINEKPKVEVKSTKSKTRKRYRVKKVHSVGK